MATNSINILLKARDEASPSINKTATSTDKLKTSMQSASGASTGMGGSLMKVAGPLAVVAGGFLAAKAAAAAAKAAFNSFTALLGDSIEAFATQEQAMQGNSQELQDYASELQNATNVGDEVILKAMQLARGMGVQEDSMKQVTQSAIALSAATGKGLDESMKILAQSTLKGTEALEEAFPALANITDEEERNAYITQQLGEGWEKASGETSTLRGALTALGNTWGDILEKIGELLAPFITKISDWFKRIGPIIGNVVSQALPIMQAFAQKMQEAAIFIGEKLVFAFTFVEQAVLNWRQVMAIAMLFVYQKIIGFVEDVKYFFTGVIPEYIKWFADNFLNIFRDMFVAYVTMWQNRIKQIIDLVSVFWDVVTGKLSGGDAMRRAGEIAGRSMLEGFVATTKPLPEIAERQLTFEEKAVGAAIKGLNENFMDKVGDKFDERMKFFQDTFATDFEMDFKGTEGVDLTTKKTKDEAKKEKEDKALTLQESRFLTRSRKTPGLEKQDRMIAQQDKMIETQKEMITFLKDQVTALKDIVSKLPDENVIEEVVLP